MSRSIAIIGGGPAGAVCALKLAQGGARVWLFERDPQREKPCGGGLTERALRVLPELRGWDLPWLPVRKLSFVSHSGRMTTLEPDEPVHVLPRVELDGALRRKAVEAGAELIAESVDELQPRPGGGWTVNGRSVEILVGAGGMNCPVAKRQGLLLPNASRAIAVGRWVPGQYPPHIICRFFPEFSGYTWWFPRREHASLGIEMPAAFFQTDRAWALLKFFAERNLPGIEVSAGEAYGWTGPIISDQQWAERRLCGTDWLVVGDAAGLVDGTTGEGISYALASGRFAAEAILAGNLAGYEKRLRESLISELAKSARLAKKFYIPWLSRLAVFGLSRSGTARAIACEVAHGRQSYLTLKDRVYKILPRLVYEILADK